MANNITMESLKERAVWVHPGMIAVFPQFEEALDVSVSGLAPKFNGCYATNNSTVCFVSDNEVFVTPYTRNIIRALQCVGFCEKTFYVPFSNGDYPKVEQFRWNSLRNMARQSYADDFVSDCQNYSDEHHFGFISEETLSKCFEMPATGVKVRHHYFEDCYYPIINSACFDCIAADRIGHFCTNNGKVVFTYRNGKTYVAKGYKILDELRAAGYTEIGLFVPFSNGEEILDPTLRDLLASI